MFDIKATFENGEVQHFGEPKVLYHYMQDEGHTSAKIESSYCLIRLPKMTMSLADVADWASHGGAEDIERPQQEEVAPVQQEETAGYEVYIFDQEFDVNFTIAVFQDRADAMGYCASMHWHYTDENGYIWNLDCRPAERRG